MEKAAFPWQYDAPPMAAFPNGETIDYDTEIEDEFEDHVEKRSVEIDENIHRKIRQATTTFDYAEILDMSMEFYEAQRSGGLPGNKTINWRGDSALEDRGFNYEDLTGGYYDAGDHVKFGLPMAFTTTTLAWGAIRYKDTYEAIGQLNLIRDTIKWATDYFIRAHISPNEFYSQVGEGSIDHQYWVSPEEMEMVRPARMVSETTPGSDVAGETAAALAAASIVFEDFDPAYSEILKTHAAELFLFANTSRGCYDAGGYYASTKYGDELAWAAAWLYYATSDPFYLAEAEDLYYLYARPRPWAHSWAEKNAGVQLLLWQFTGTSVYKKKVNKFVDNWLPAMSLPYTPDGLVFRNEWGPLRYTAGTCMIALIAAEEGLDSLDVYVPWARGQLHYMLGDNAAGQSFVVGLGENSPKSPHHRASSCTVGLNNNAALTSPDPNPHLLRGALVGGPDANDVYTDNRQDYISNEVACDYNAAFQTAIAGM
ncbi:endoglucanase E-4-like [Glandiceps talaboti]